MIKLINLVADKDNGSEVIYLTNVYSDDKDNVYVFYSNLDTSPKDAQALVMESPENYLVDPDVAPYYLADAA